LLANSLADIDALKVEIFTPTIANHVPHLKVTWDQDRLKVSADDIRLQLRSGAVSIEAVPTYSYESAADSEEIRFGVWMMQPNEAETVAQRLREVFLHAVHLSARAKTNG
jgi:L-seryl-tRNA(Ser) seleniumtransferase